MEREILREMGKRYPQVAPFLNVTFKPEGINALRVLWALGQRGLVKFESDILILAIIESGRWEYDANRVVKARFPLGLLWNDEIFMDRVAKDIESIRFPSVYPLNVLMTGRQKVQKDNAIRIISDCYGDLNYIDLLEDLQLQFMGELEIVHGLPQITFKLEALIKTVAMIVLDGWSGQMIVNGIPQQKVYGDPKEFHNIVRKLAYEYMEKVTAPA
jgi:hypothetical protein